MDSPLLFVITKFINVINFYTDTFFMSIFLCHVSGGFPSGESDPGNRSVAMMKVHIKELMSKLAKAEEDKQKIADEAYR